MAKTSVTCAYCGALFERENKQLNYNKRNGLPNYCSHSCSAKASWEKGNLDHLKTGRSPETPETIANRKKLQKEWYQKNRERLVEKARAERQRKRELIDSFKVECCVCGESRKPCLIFHHKDPTEKEFNISQAIHRFSDERIRQEIAKCDVMCANCHRVLHRKARHA